MQQVGISDIQRNLHKLDNFDIVEVVDKKRGKVKGYFIDKKYAQAIQKLIKQQRETQSKSIKLAGCLSAYADSELLDSEDKSWKNQVEEKYSL